MINLFTDVFSTMYGLVPEIFLTTQQESVPGALHISELDSLVVFFQIRSAMNEGKEIEVSGFSIRSVLELVRSLSIIGDADMRSSSSTQSTKPD
jgi:hypothetical protein